ncbi:MAG: SRPBCC family protein [Pseudomonadota bacterium]
MRLLRNILVGLVVVAAVLVATGYMMPPHVIVERSISIDATAEAVFPLVNSLRRGQEWSPWLARDPETVVEFSGPEEGVGAAMEWASENPQVGSGAQEITASIANERVETALDFGAQGPATAWFVLADGPGGGTELTWGLDADMGNSPIGRWMGLMMDGWVGPDYEQGLINIKSLVEAGS